MPFAWSLCICLSTKNHPCDISDARLNGVPSPFLWCCPFPQMWNKYQVQGKEPRLGGSQGLSPKIHTGPKMVAMSAHPHFGKKPGLTASIYWCTTCLHYLITICYMKQLYQYTVQTPSGTISWSVIIQHWKFQLEKRLTWSTNSCVNSNSLHIYM